MNKIIINEKKLYSFLAKIDFNCQKCSVCCRIDPGAVFLTKHDVDKISKNLCLNINEFLKEYCRGIDKGFKTMVSLKEKLNYDCIFWDNGCTIYTFRPLQCRTYPFWPFIVESKERWEKEATRCKGINKKGSLSIEEKFNLYKKEKEAVYMEWGFVGQSPTPHL